MQIRIRNQAKRTGSCLFFVVKGAVDAAGLGAEDLAALIMASEQPLAEPKLGSYRSTHAAGRQLHIYVLPEASITAFQFKKIMQTINLQVRASGDQTLNVFADQVQVDDWDREKVWTQITLALAEVAYRFDQYKSGTKPPRLKEVDLIMAKKQSPFAARLQALMNGVFLARDLGNAPGNVCTPIYLAQQARALRRQYAKRLKCKVLGEAELKKLGMHAYLAVAGGSANPPRFILMEYKGRSKSSRPLVLLGKGITFDTGGISIKPSAAMDEMKYDMSGAAAVFGAMRALCELQLPINVVGAVAAAENMPGARAYRPGDIIRTMSGRTVEVLNTDAEGRMVLCDALTYVRAYKPTAVVDMATLTGACIIALGHLRSGFFANDEDLAERLQDAARQSQDHIWRMPLDEDYMEDMRSNFADLANVGGRAAGTVTAAGFLARFTTDYPWAHLDIAGTAWQSGKQKGSTGRPVPLLVQFLLDSCSR